MFEGALMMNKNTNQYLAIDIGGTFIKYSVMDSEYNCYDEGSIRTKKLPAEFLEQLTDLIEAYLEKINGIAICMGGFFDPLIGENTDFSVGSNFKAYNLKTIFSEKYQIPVLLENDSNCAALGEMVQGAARGYKNFCMVTFGTGIGGAIVINSKLYRGSNYKAGEVGFTKVRIKEESGNIRAESAGATSALVKKVSECLNFEVDGRYIFTHMHNTKIATVYREWISKGAIVIGNLAVTVDPEILLIGGGISENNIFINDMKKEVYRLYPHLEEYTAIKASERGNMAGKIGALYLLLQKESAGV